MAWNVKNSHGEWVEMPDTARQALVDAWLDGYQNGAGDPYFAPSDDEDIERKAKAYAEEELP
jgi:hypothetical protein